MKFLLENLIRREGIDAIILILTLPFTISKLGPSAMDRWWFWFKLQNADGFILSTKDQYFC